MRKLNFKPMFWLIGIIVLSMVIGISCAEEGSSTSKKSGGGPVLAEITVVQTPDYTYPLTATEVNKSSVTVTAKYSDNKTTKIVTNSPDCKFYGFPNTPAEGPKEITVTYQEGTASVSKKYFITFSSGTTSNVHQPTANPASGHSVNAPSTITVTLATSTESPYSMYYTTDGSLPTSSYSRTLYSGPITISDSGTTTLKAITTKDGVNSSILEATYNIINTSRTLTSIDVVNNKASYALGELLDITVTANYSNGTSQIVTSYQVSEFDKNTAGSHILNVTYTENGTPAYKQFTAVYQGGSGGGSVANPTANRAPGQVASGTLITLSCSTDGASIRYTTDNSNPSSTTGTIGTQVTITGTTTVKAIAYKAGMTDSSVVSFAYTVGTVQQPSTLVVVANPDSGTYPDPITVELSTMDGARIVYTTLGGLSDAEIIETGDLYTGPISVGPGNTAIKAFALDADGRPGVKKVASYYVGRDDPPPDIAGEYTIIWYEIPSSYSTTAGTADDQNYVRFACSMPVGYKLQIREIFWANTIFNWTTQKNNGVPADCLFKLDFGIPKSYFTKLGWGLDGPDTQKLLKGDGFLTIEPFGVGTNANISGSISMAGLAWDKFKGFDPSKMEDGDKFRPHTFMWAKYIGVSVRSDLVDAQGYPKTGNNEIPDDACIKLLNTTKTVRFNQFSTNGTQIPGRTDNLN